MVTRIQQGLTETLRRAEQDSANQLRTQVDDARFVLGACRGELRRVLALVAAAQRGVVSLEPRVAQLAAIGSD